MTTQQKTLVNNGKIRKYGDFRMKTRAKIKNLRTDQRIVWNLNGCVFRFEGGKFVNSIIYKQIVVKEFWHSHRNTRSFYLSNRCHWNSNRWYCIVLYCWRLFYSSWWCKPAILSFSFYDVQLKKCERTTQEMWAYNNSTCFLWE